MTDRELIEKAWGYLASYTVGERPNTSAVNDLGFILESRLAQPERQWVGLTDQEIRDLWSWSATEKAERTATTQQHAFANAIETKLKEKNT